MQVRRSRRIQEQEEDIDQELLLCPDVPLDSLRRHSGYQRWLTSLLDEPRRAADNWLQLPISYSHNLRIPIPPISSRLARQQHNTLVFYLTSSSHSTLPTYYLHDPTDPSPPTVFFSSNPKWVEREAITYARSRIQVCSSAVVGVYVECPNNTYMIAMFHLNSYLFLSLSYRIPLSITATLYSSIQLDNSLSRVSRLLSICIGNSLVDRHSEQTLEIEDALSICTSETTFFEDFDNDERHHQLDRLTNYATLLAGFIRSGRNSE